MCCSFFFLEAVGANWGRHAREPPARKQTKAARREEQFIERKRGSFKSNQIKSNPLFEHVTIRSTECSLKRAHVYALLLIKILIIHKYKKNDPINFRERMIMAMSKIGHVSLSSLTIILIF